MTHETHGTFCPFMQATSRLLVVVKSMHIYELADQKCGTRAHDAHGIVLALILITHLVKCTSSLLAVELDAAHSLHLISTCLCCGPSHHSCACEACSVMTGTLLCRCRCNIVEVNGTAVLLLIG